MWASHPRKSKKPPGGRLFWWHVGHRSVAEQRAFREAPGLRDFAAAKLLAVFETSLQHLNNTALRGDFETGRRHLGYLADLSRDIGEAAEQSLAGVKYLQLFAVIRRPCTGCGITAADQIEHVVNRFGPVYLRLGSAAPAFVARLRFILDDFLVLAGDHQVRRFEHGADTQRKQA